MALLGATIPMKPTRFLLAALAVAPLLGAPTFAAPIATAPIAATEPALPTEAPKSADELAALAIFDESIKAYAALPSLSQSFTFSSSNSRRPDKEQSGNGTFSFMRPDKARVAYKMGERDMFAVSDGTTLIRQLAANKFESDEAGDKIIPQTALMLPGGTGLPLLFILDGVNPLQDAGLALQKLAPANEKGQQMVTLVSIAGGDDVPQTTFRVTLDTKTHLATRIESELNVAARPGVDGKPDVKAVKIVDTIQFAPAPAVAASDFTFVTPAGATLTQVVERPKPYDERLVVGAQPFALSDKTLDGKPFSLDAYKGKVVLLDFWATWCGPCIGELPNVKANYEKYKPQGFDIVGISLDEDEEALRGFIKKREMPWAQLFDGKGWENVDAGTYGVRAIPFTLLLAKDGTIAAVNPRGEDLEPAIKAAIAK